MEPICPLDTELKAGDGFKMGHMRYFIRKKGGFGLAGGGTMQHVRDLDNPSDEGKHTL